MTFEDYQSKYPLVYRERPISGMDIPDGWHVLINNLSRDISEHLKEFPNEKFRVLQIKSKFAFLCFYVEYADQRIKDLISEYVSQSCKICEMCGAPAKKYSSGTWLYTLCDTHILELGNR